MVEKGGQGNIEIGLYTFWAKIAVKVY